MVGSSIFNHVNISSSHKITILIIFLFRFSIKRYQSLTLCPTAIWQTNGTTVAGSNAGTSGSTSTKLNSPTAVFINNSSMIYVLDANNYRVERVLSNSTTGTTVINSSSGTGLNQFSSSKFNIV